jgi:hypothetical protein
MPSKFAPYVLALLAIPASLSAGDSNDNTVFGDWAVNATTDRAHVFAGTENESHSSLAEFCSMADGSCHWILLIDVACQNSGTSPVLGNTDSGSVALSVSCVALLPLVLLTSMSF